MTIDRSIILNEPAIFSPCRTFRYTLARRWSDVDKFVMFIGLNPSTADETQDDPTIRRCIGFAKQWGAGGLLMTNLFALRSTDPMGLRRHASSVGENNDEALRVGYEACGRSAVAAWGVHGRYLDRDKAVSAMLTNLHCLGVTKDGHPRHPLYLSSDTKTMRLEARP